MDKYTVVNSIDKDTIIEFLMAHGGRVYSKVSTHLDITTVEFKSGTRLVFVDHWLYALNGKVKINTLYVTELEWEVFSFENLVSFTYGYGGIELGEYSFIC